MILTWKCKEAFIDYLDKTNQITIEKGILKLHWQDFPEKYIHALIIDFFDSVGIYISVKRLCTSLKFRCWYFIITNKDGNYLNKHSSDESRINNDSRIEITIEVIKKANEIYNEK